MVVISVVTVGIEVGSGPGAGRPEVVRQMAMIIGLMNVIIAFPVALATMYYAKRSGELTDLETRRVQEAKSENRRGVVLALLGAAKETAGYAGWVVELQRRGLKWYRSIGGDSPAQLAFSVEGWKQLSAAVARVSIAMERVRLDTPDLADEALPIFDSAVAAMQSASRGDPAGLERQAQNISDQADQLRAAVLGD
jgi:hypothetical protein